MMMKIHRKLVSVQSDKSESESFAFCRPLKDLDEGEADTVVVHIEDTDFMLHPQLWITNTKYYVIYYMEI
jgi:hypothetical protein